MSFKAEVLAKIGWAWSDGVLDKSEQTFTAQFNDGNAVNQAEAVWHSELRELASGNSETFDLSALVRTVFGDTLTTAFHTVRAILVVNESTDPGAGEVLIGGAASNEWTYPFGSAGDQVSVPVDSVLMLSNRQWGWAVNAGAKNLKIAADGGDAVYSIVIVGTITTPAGGSSGT